MVSASHRPWNTADLRERRGGGDGAAPTTRPPAAPPCLALSAQHPRARHTFMCFIPTQRGWKCWCLKGAGTEASGLRAPAVSLRPGAGHQAPPAETDLMQGGGCLHTQTRGCAGSAHPRGCSRPACPSRHPRHACVAATSPWGLPCTCDRTSSLMKIVGARAVPAGHPHPRPCEQHARSTHGDRDPVTRGLASQVTAPCGLQSRPQPWPGRPAQRSPEERLASISGEGPVAPRGTAASPRWLGRARAPESRCSRGLRRRPQRLPQKPACGWLPSGDSGGLPTHTLAPESSVPSSPTGDSVATGDGEDEGCQAVPRDPWPHPPDPADALLTAWPCAGLVKYLPLGTLLFGDRVKLCHVQGSGRCPAAKEG